MTPFHVIANIEFLSTLYVDIVVNKIWKNTTGRSWRVNISLARLFVKLVCINDVTMGIFLSSSQNRKCDSSSFHVNYSQSKRNNCGWSLKKLDFWYSTIFFLPCNTRIFDSSHDYFWYSRILKYTVFFFSYHFWHDKLKKKKKINQQNDVGPHFGVEKFVRITNRLWVKYILNGIAYK